MSTNEKETRAQHLRDAVRTLATARASTTRLQHGVENTAGVIGAKAKAVAADAAATAAEMKSKATKGLDDARVNAAKGQHK